MMFSPSPVGVDLRTLNPGKWVYHREADQYMLVSIEHRIFQTITSPSIQTRLMIRMFNSHFWTESEHLTSLPPLRTSSYTLVPLRNTDIADYHKEILAMYENSLESTL